MKNVIEKLPSLYRKDIERAIEILKKSGAKEIYIFGSIVNGNTNNNSDIDLAVKGIYQDDFYKVLSVLYFELKNNVDLVDLDDKENRFSKMLLESGELLKVG